MKLGPVARNVQANADAWRQLGLFEGAPQITLLLQIDLDGPHDLAKIVVNAFETPDGETHGVVVLDKSIDEALKVARQELARYFNAAVGRLSPF